ncbi:phosphoglycerate mutase-like protein [Xylaria venustula]|nr:phosphoglycerate mutase-like protein [Xylaria venustula]
MRLLLIRHGESVDNVAGLYAGSRDSSLTNHGILQAQRLGAHISLAVSCCLIGPVQHIFASNLQRAYQTADAVAEACQLKNDVTLGVTRVEELREKDFGLSEGKRFSSKDKDDGSESPVSMRIRIDRFLDRYLGPTVEQLVTENATVVIVAHGIILNVLLKALLSRYPPQSLASQLIAERPGSEYLAPWSNTGVLEARLQLSESNTSFQIPDAEKVRMTIVTTNNVDHLQGLKKTRGGIGSAKFDSRQRTMDSFFTSSSKKRKFDDDEAQDRRNT